MTSMMKNPAGYRPGVATAIAIGAVAAAAMVGASQGPQTPSNAVWYATLKKPRVTPPGPAIAVTWITLEALLCVAGVKLMRDPPSAPRNQALLGWWGVLAGLATFPRTFFRDKRLGRSAVVSSAMLGAAAVSVARAAKVDKAAAGSMTPVLLWLCIATGLSADLWRRNRR